jgi:hypothetical protein
VFILEYKGQVNVIGIQLVILIFKNKLVLKYKGIRDRSLFMEGGEGNFFFPKFLKLKAPP